LTDAALAIHYPKEGETISSREYTFRVMTRLPGPVEISVDGGPWVACRPAVGYWWHDWKCSGEGSHDIRARVYDEGGTAHDASPRPFTVVCKHSRVESQSESSGESSISLHPER